MKNLIFVFAFLISVSVFGQGACNNQTSVTHHGYEYDIVAIGDQCWFAENCRYLPEVSPPSEGSETDPYFYVYGYEGTDVFAAQATANYDTYGVLYNWPAVMTEGLCPSGWHIPTEAEWQTMEISLGMSWSEAAQTGWRGTDEGYQMKSSSGWMISPSDNGSNSSGFTGLPGGYCAPFNSTGYYEKWASATWWSSSEKPSSVSDRFPQSWVRTLGYDMDDVGRGGGVRHAGFSARCVRDYSTTSSVPTEPSSNRKLEKVVDVLGREVKHTTNQILFHIYDDGSVEKKFVVD
jgi:uncharacterized protein (TIGR02145 family)